MSVKLTSLPFTYVLWIKAYPGVCLTDDTTVAECGGDAGASGPSAADQELLLGLTHLNKLFEGFQKRRGSSSKSGSNALANEEEEAQLYAMLPLFCKVFSTSAHQGSSSSSGNKGVAGIQMFGAPRKAKKSPLIGKHYSLPFLPGNPSTSSQTLEGLFELTRRLSRTLA